ncbi:MAG: oligosaccharide flippase family protein [Thermoplasmata archaeon]
MDAVEVDDRSGAMLSVGRGTIVMALATVVSLFFNFIARVAVARGYSVAAWGEFSLGVALAGLLSIVAVMGLPQAVARALAYEHDPDRRRRIIRTGLAITGITSVAASALVFLFSPELAHLFSGGAAPATSGGLTLVFQMFSVTVGFTLMANFLAALFQGFEDAGPNAWFNNMVNPGLFVVFVLLFIVLHLGFFGALLAYTLASASAFVGIAIFTAVRFHRNLERPFARSTASLPSNFYPLTLALWGVTSLAFLTLFVDTLILGVFWPPTIVGEYSSQTILARLVLVVNSALLFIYLPVSARLVRANDFQSLRWTFATSTRWVLGIAIPLLLLFVFLPDESLTAVFGAKYATGQVALSILVIGSFLSVAVGPVTSCLSGLAATRVLLWSSLASMLTNVILSLVLIPPYGLLGAAIAWSVARVLYPSLGAIVLSREWAISTWKRSVVLPTVLAFVIGAPLFAIVNLFHPVYWLVYPLYFVGVGIFILAVLATRSLDAGDLIFARSIENALNVKLSTVERLIQRFTEDTPQPLPSDGPGPP